MQILIKLKVGAQNAKMNHSFGPILGQNGINIKDFCDLFNKVSCKFYPNLPLNVYLLKISTKQFEIKEIKIDRQFLLNFYKEQNSHSIKLSNFYKLVYIYAKANKYKIMDKSSFIGLARQLYHSDPNLTIIT